MTNNLINHVNRWSYYFMFIVTALCAIFGECCVCVPLTKTKVSTFPLNQKRLTELYGIIHFYVCVDWIAETTITLLCVTGTYIFGVKDK